MITTVTLNTSIDKAYIMSQKIKNGTVMRVPTCRNSAGGKGINVARIAKLCGSEVLACGLCGGYNGEYLKALLTEDGINHKFISIAGETRSCINILDPEYGSTEYLEPGCHVTMEEEEIFLQKFSFLIEKSEVVTISGSVPSGMSADIYSKLIRMIKAQNKTVILDTSGKSLQLALSEKPTMVKPNIDEIESLFDVKVTSMEKLIYYAEKIAEFGISYVVISLGKDGALLVCEEGIFHGICPEVKVVNTVGCGDSMVAALAVAMEKRYTPQEALRYAVAVATSSAMCSETGSFDVAVFKAIYNEVKIEKPEHLL